MIGYLKGQVIEVQEGRVLLGVGMSASGGVGYQLAVPQSSSAIDILPGKTLEFFVHTHVREDALDLFGFVTRLEKDLFLTLLTVNGIGPKGALGLMSKIEPSQLIELVLAEDKESLCKVPGIGKKTAERVVLELKDPFQKRVDSGAWKAGPIGTKSTGATSSASALQREAREALLGLGYRDSEIGVLLKKLFDERPEISRVEDVIKLSLQRMTQ